MSKEEENRNPASPFLKTDRGKTKSNAIEVPSITLPKGGGAIKGIDEKFSVNAVNGTASFSLPLPFSPARGASPALSLSYNSGAGNGVFGLGWTLSFPSIKRKTDKGLPQYLDEIDSDTFLFSEAEDLVPEFKREPDGNFSLDINGNYLIREKDSADGLFTIRFYRPRVEGLFARIERWSSKTSREIKWRVITKENVTTLFGWSPASKISDPEDPDRTFEWLPEFVFDDKGNCSRYIYKKEDSAGFDRSLLHNRNRFKDGNITYTNAYLEKVLYGNKTPYKNFNNPFPLDTDYFFQTVFDYGEYNLNAPYDKVNSWDFRKDPFSEYKAGFEVRTTRLCRRVLLFHYFSELPGSSALVKSLNVEYDTAAQENFTFLKSITSFGYIKKTDNTYSYKNLPPIEFEYQRHEWNTDVKTIASEDLVHAPSGLDEPEYQFTDLFNEGLSGILTEQGGGWFYKHSLGGGRFEQAKPVTPKPSFAGLGSRLQVMDLDADGSKQLVSLNNEPKGYFELNEEEEWQAFRAFEKLPNINMANPDTRMIDLDGDGRPEALITEDNVFTWYESAGRKGFERVHKTIKPFDEEAGPHVVFSDHGQSIFLADMSGDGLTDIVRIRNGEVCYWPNLGYGRFGAKVGMDNAPVFDHPDSFNPAFLRLADIDGSGTTDIIYLGKSRFTCWMNASGNTFGTVPFEIDAFPEVNNQAKITVTDLLGNGVACIVWSSPLAKDAHAPLQYIDLMNSKKPHILVFYKNNLGKEVSLEYTPSTRFYIEDKLAGRPWVTKLHFPVHCISKSETRDRISGYRFVSSYKYHHGYYDHAEREFRGFGMVEQTDAEHFDHWIKGDASNIVDKTLHQEPVVTKTWFHTGVYKDRHHISQQYTEEYYQGDPQAVLLPDTILEPGLSIREEHEACRALKGSILRQEIYALDDSPESPHPYRVSERNYELRRMQPPGSNRHAVFLAHARETLDYHYERNPTDPRISHALTLAVDDFGNVTRSAAIAYPRRTPVYDEQAGLLCTCSQNDFINLPDEETFYRVGVPYQTRSYEITGLVLNGTPFSLEDIRTAVQSAVEINYEEQAAPGVLQKRLIEREQTRYYRNDLNGPLPFGRAESLALPYESYRMAFTPGLLEQTYQAKIDYATLSTILIDEGRFQFRDSVWWDPSGHQVFDPQLFYLPARSIDPFGNTYEIDYDDYSLLVTGIEDPLGNRETAENDYRMLQPRMETDANLNRSAVQFDELGMVIATAEMGKEGLNEGDTLDDSTTRLEYELFNWMHNSKPNFVHTLAREQHGDINTRWLETYAYSDGLGHEVSSKVRAEPGLAPGRDCEGSLLHDANGDLVWTHTSPNARWVGSGRKVFNNKGNPVKQYEPFFSGTHEYEDEAELVEWGVTPLLRYDPLGRLIRTDNPNGTFSKVAFDPWQERSHDENDTVLDSDWYAERINLPAGDPQRRAAELSAQHYNSPATVHLDTLGRSFLSIADNGPHGQYPTHTGLDIESNPRVITDARGNPVMQYAYNMIGPSNEEKEEDEEASTEEGGRPDGHLIYQNSMDAGERWMLYNVAGNPIRTWDSRDHVFRYEYDALQRQTYLYVQTDNNPEILAEQIVYGESHADAIARNLRGRIYRQYDGAGVVTNEHFDFKDNLLQNSRQLAIDYTAAPDWTRSPDLETETFTTATEYDALNRPTAIRTPDSSVYRPIYNEANLLNAVNVNLRGAATPTELVTNIDYNAKAQRETIEYANGVTTRYTYDPHTFRLNKLTTTRASDNKKLQDLSYVYDPVGNITAVRDDAQQTIYFSNAVVEPYCRYEYDALYRLISATGREHLGQTAGGQLNPPQQTNNSDGIRMNKPHPGDGQAMGNYQEQYEYDGVGNILKMIHDSGKPGRWLRYYDYETGSNRLRSTSLPTDPPDGPYSQTYHYDAHGNMISMPHLPNIQWDHEDRMQQVDLGGGGTAWYVYDAAGERVRKIVMKNGGSLIEERIYLGGFEIYRKRNAGGLTLERETLHIMDDKERIAMVETKTIDADVTPFTPTPITRYQINNHLGSSSLELDESGSIISYEEYYPYGSTSYHAAGSGVEVSQKRYRYTGKERDEETGLYYYGARYYVPWLGLWVNCDPLGMEDGTNLYKYVMNNPVSLVDPDGRRVRRVPNITRVSGPWDITESLARRIQKKMKNAYVSGSYECTHQVSNYIGGAMTGKVYYPGIRSVPWTQEKVYDITSKSPPTGFTPSRRMKLADEKIKKLVYGVGRTGRAKGAYRPLGLVDRLKFHSATPGLPRGWYVERGRPDDESSYQLVKTPQGVPLRLESGDRLYTAQGHGSSGFDLKHESLVVIEGNKISLWGAWSRGAGAGPEERGTNVLYLKVRDFTKLGMKYDRRIVIRVLRPDYSQGKRSIVRTLGYENYVKLYPHPAFVPPANPAWGTLQY